jgi:hypothetical protein
MRAAMNLGCCDGNDNGRFHQIIFASESQIGHSWIRLLDQAAAALFARANPPAHAIGNGQELSLNFQGSQGYFNQYTDLDPQNAPVVCPRPPDLVYL